MRTPQPCGTPAAYKRHYANKEPVCDPCRTAQNIKRTKQRKQTPRAPKPSTTETIQEIEHLLMCGEGEHAILKATGYKPDTLERLLHRAGRKDLIPRIFHGEQRMVWAA